ncbi:MAG: erythromycin esterase family protein [Sphingomonas sp.]|uniref:erythromycin esterase family protein n=1 Tax=Sphingomonas sp. TaxID=28214 RepID=UPI0025D0674B|nr:erythromycin esterase family protein [Sphingomonas sp.]MBX9880585.1 erythromycin esterase family protein [Sphingomonas sp.]
MRINPSRRGVLGGMAAAAFWPGTLRAASAGVSPLPGADFPPTAPGARAFLAATRAARVIGLGEATHGSHEIFELKTSFITALAQAGRLSAIGFEIGGAAMLPLDEIVREGRPDAIAPLLKATGNFTVATAEMTALIELIRRINQSRPAARRIALFGYDVQTPGADAAAIVALCDRAKVAVAFPAPFTELAANPRPIQAYNPATASAFVAAVAPARAAFQAARPALEAALGAPAVAARARLFDAIDNAFALFKQPSFEAAYAQRDAFGAQRILAEAKQTTGQVAVWAHNGHINRETHEFSGVKLLGGVLGDALGAGYFALGTAFRDGEARAQRQGVKGVIVNTLGPARDGSLDVALAALGKAYFVTLPQLERLPGWRERAAAQLGLRAIGGGYEPENDTRTYRPTTLATQYDGIAFIDTVSASTPL